MYLVQSVLFNKQLWNIPESKKWLKKNGYISRKVDEKPHFLRFRQRDPKKLEKEEYKFRTKKLGKSGIELVIAYKNNPYRGLGLEGESSSSESDSESDDEMVGGVSERNRRMVDTLLADGAIIANYFVENNYETDNIKIINQAEKYFKRMLPRILKILKREEGEDYAKTFNETFWDINGMKELYWYIKGKENYSPDNIMYNNNEMIGGADEGDSDRESNEFNEGLYGNQIPIDLAIYDFLEEARNLWELLWDVPEDYLPHHKEDIRNFVNSNYLYILFRIERELGIDALNQFKNDLENAGFNDLKRIAEAEGSGRNNFCNNNIMISLQDKKRQEGQRHLEGKLQSRQKSDKTLRSAKERVFTEQHQKGSSVNERTLYYY